MIPDFFIIIVGGGFLALAAFQFYLMFRLNDLDKTIADIAKIVLNLKKPDEEGDKTV